MGITLTSSPKLTLLRAVPADDETLKQDRDRLSKVPGKKPVYKKGLFSHWEIPVDNLCYILEQFSMDEIYPDEGVIKLADEYEILNTPIEELPKWEGEIYPSKDGKVPRPWQEKTIRVSLEKKNFIISYDVGLGKSLTAALRAKSVGSKKTLVIVPKKLMDEWEDTFWKTYKERAFIFYATTKKKREELKSRLPDEPIIITNFETVKHIPLDIEFDFVIIDEIHILSNHGAAITKAAKRLLGANPNAHKIGLSATPERKHVGDLFNVIKLVEPRWGGSRTAFLRKFQKVVAYKKIRKFTATGQPYFFKVPIRVKTVNQEELKRKISSMIIRETHEGKLNFEDHIDIVHVGMEPKQQKLYNEILQEVREEVKLNPSQPLVKMLRLLQVAEGTHTLDEDDSHSGKFKFLEQDLKDQGDRKACILFRFLPGTRKFYEKYKDKTVLYTGDMNDAQQKYAKWAFNGVPEDKIEEFNKIKEKYGYKFGPGEAQYIVLTYNQRSGMGLNLEQGSLLYFMSFDFSPVALKQGRGRIIRLTQEKNCETKLIVTKGTIEPKSVEKILKTLEEHHNLLDGKASEQSNLQRELVELLNEDF